MQKNIDKLNFICYNLLDWYGEVSEWFKELVLKTSDTKVPRVRISSSLPVSFGQVLNLPKINWISFKISVMEKYSRGRRGAPAKGVGRSRGARVRIPLSPLVDYFWQKLFSK